MAIAIRHVLRQGPMIAALGRIAIAGFRRPASALPVLPTPWIDARVMPPPAALVHDYIRHVGGDPAWYRGRLPTHLFPQWGLPLAARALTGLPYSVARVINAGCRIENRAPLPSGERLHVRARIESVDDDGHRAIVTQRIVTGTAAAPEALVAEVRAYLPRAPRANAGEPKRSPRVQIVPPSGAHEIAFMRLGADAGLRFAELTGDFNPIHWLPPYARAVGFGACILHGYSTLGRAIEALHRGHLSGDPSRLVTIDASFTRPLRLPASIGIYVDRAGRLWVGDAPQGRTYLEGHFETEMRP